MPTQQPLDPDDIDWERERPRKRVAEPSTPANTQVPTKSAEDRANEILGYKVMGVVGVLVLALLVLPSACTDQEATARREREQRNATEQRRLEELRRERDALRRGDIPGSSAREKAEYLRRLMGGD